MARPKKTEAAAATDCTLTITFESRVGDRKPMTLTLEECSPTVQEHTVKCFEHVFGTIGAQTKLASAAGLPTNAEEIKKLLGL